MLLVIQPNMSPDAIVSTWDSTKKIFKEFDIAITENAMESYVKKDILPQLLKILNEEVGSSALTCIEGG